MRRVLSYIWWPLLFGVCVAVTYWGVVNDMTIVVFNVTYLSLALTIAVLERVMPHEQAWLANDGQVGPDIAHTLLNKSIAQALVLSLTFLGLAELASPAGHAWWPGSLPVMLQVALGLVFVEFGLYWKHRLAHEWPPLWRFHAVHHSAQHMDWMAGARMHFFEILVLRGTTVFPMILLGFSQTAVNAYVLVVYLFATFAHSNLGWRLGLMDKFFVTPRFHHWHHGIEKEAVDVNFAIHFPLFDKIFGTHHMPENNRWPSGYGIGGHPVPKGYWQQFLYPFRRKK